MSTQTKAHLASLNVALHNAQRYERILPGHAMRKRVVALQSAIVSTIANR